MTPAGKLVLLGRRNLRAPLTVAENITRHGGDSAWPPTFVYETAEAVVLQFLGILLRDGELRLEGKQQEERLMRLSAAQGVREDADQLRRTADDELSDRREEAEQLRAQAEETNADAQGAVAEKASKQKERAAKRAAQAQSESASQEMKAQEDLRQGERDAERTRVREERTALAKRKEASDAQRRAEMIDDALEQTKNGRR